MDDSEWQSIERGQADSEKPDRCDQCGKPTIDLNLIQLGPKRFQWLCETDEDGYYFNLEQ